MCLPRPDARPGTHGSSTASAPGEPIGAAEGDFIGAAGDEVDGAEPALGSPPTAVVVATSRGRHDHRYTPMDQGIGTDRGERDPVRADMVYAVSPAGGRLFAVGSMGWTNAVLRGGDTEVVTANVLAGFLGEEPDTR